MKNRAQTAQALQNVFCPFFKKKEKGKIYVDKKTLNKFINILLDYRKNCI